MKTHFLLLAILWTLSSAINPGFAQTQPSKGLAAAKAAITESNRIYFNAFVKNDPEQFIARYAKDCLIMAPGALSYEGHAGARAFFKLAYEQFGLRNGKFITTNVYGNGDDYVTEEGLWQSFDEHQRLYDDGKFLVLWKITPEGWKMFRDSFSSNRVKK